MLLRRFLFPVTRSAPHPTVQTVVKATLSTTSGRRAAARASPAVKRARLARGKPKPHPSVSDQKVLSWPYKIFDDAFRSGASQISPARCMLILDDFSKLYSRERPTVEDIGKLCRDNGIALEGLTILAKILLRTGQEEYHPIAFGILHTVSDQKEPGATLFLISVAAKSSKLHSTGVSSAKIHLRELVEEGSTSAMILQAQILENQGEKAKALQLYERAIDAENDGIASTVANTSTQDFGLAWVAVARLKGHSTDREGAKKAYERAAFHYDDPWAYYCLAIDTGNVLNPQSIQYLLKAAASGVPQAAHKLGMYYFALAQQSAADSNETTLVKEKNPLALRKGPWMNRGNSPSSPTDNHENWRLAAAWLGVAAESPMHAYTQDSRLFLAITLRKIGEEQKGMEWLDVAAKASTAHDRHRVMRLKNDWHNKVDFTQMDVTGPT